jgi:hypothetical protein
LGLGNEHRRKKPLRAKRAACLAACAILLFGSIVPLAGQSPPQSSEILERMIPIVMENNPTLASQNELVRASSGFPKRGPTFALTTLNVTAGTSYWDLSVGSFRFVPSLTAGVSFSIGDPVRIMSYYNLKAEREQARQQYLKIKDSAVADLFASAREILKLKSQGRSLQKLKTYLEEYTDLIERQVKAGVTQPATDQLWALKERAIGIETEIRDVDDQLNTKKIEAAMRLAGEAWRDLLALFEQLE